MGDLYYTVGPTGYYFSDGSICDSDLINIPEKIEGWVIFYKDGSVSKLLTKELKNNYVRSTLNQLACIKVSFTEGEGLP